MSTDSTSPSQSPPTPSSTTPPADSQPPPSTPAATPPPPAPTTSSPPPPAPTTSSPPPPSSTPPPATTSPPPPASTATPSPPATSTVTPATPTVTPSPPTVTPSPPAPVNAAPLPKTGALPTPAANAPPQPKPNSQGTPSRPSPNTQQSASGDGSNPTSNDSPAVDPGVVAGAVVGGAVIIILLVVIICLMCCRRKKKPQYYTDPTRAPNGANQYYNQDQAQWQNSQGFMPPHPNSSGEFNSGYQSQNPMQRAVPPSTNMGGMSTFTYEELAAATDGFSQMNLLGQGGFGFVHKGILPDKREVAVKSLKSGSGQGEREFQAEVEIISRVHHRHLVSLVGYCIAGDQKLLVYEFVANGTMEHHLYGKDQKVLDWPTRLRIAIGSAKGLAYLHEDCQPRIIHRDIKAANILIDNNFEAMVADFGLAKLTTDNHTHVSTRVMGTFGYLAPEYASSGKLSDKSDVFSFGVMLLELVTGRRPIDLTNMMEDSLVDWARPLLTEAMESGNYENLVDPRLEGNFIHSELARMAASAAASIRHSARKRPKMSQIVRALEGNSSLEDLNEGVKPGQSSQFNPSGGTEVYDTRAYNADMLKFKKMVMSTGEFESGESSDADSIQMEKR